jgi:hypothetical protein
MKNPMLSNLHPDDVALDGLRAGLLDDAATRAHVGACAVCQERLTVWDRLAHNFQTTMASDSTIARQLHDRRRAALSGRLAASATLKPRWTPQYLALAATVATLAIGLSVFVTLDRNAPDATPDTSSAQAGSASDIYADIDFYLWLTKEGLIENTPGNAS